MKYFIDFEATQFSQEIISVGCIREDGQTFYALVAPPQRMDKGVAIKDFYIKELIKRRSRD